MTRPPTHASRWFLPDAELLGIAVVSLLFSAVYAWMGPGYVLDDWFTLRNAQFEGALSAAGGDQWRARPGAALVYAVIFGTFGGQPIVALVLQALAEVASAVLIVVIVRRAGRSDIAAIVGLLWVVLPNHTSLVMWPSAANIGLSTLCGLIGVRLLLGDKASTRRWAALWMVCGVLFYEALLPVAAAATVVMPWLRLRRLDIGAIAAGTLGLGATAGWILLNWHPAKSLQPAPSITSVLQGHFGSGIVPDGTAADVAMLAALTGLLLVAASRLLGDDRTKPQRPSDGWLIVVGLAIIVLGFLPFARYFYSPFGAGDRANFVSSIGAALVWAGLWHRARLVTAPGALVALGGLLMAGTIGHVSSADRWHRAGADAEAILAVVVDRYDGVAPDEPIVLGPEPIGERGLYAFLDQSNVSSAVQVALDDPTARAGMAFSQEQFEDRSPELQVDIRPLSTLGRR